jgi:hypothetical protein
MSAQRHPLMLELVLVMEAFDHMEIDVNGEGVIENLFLNIFFMGSFTIYVVYVQMISFSRRHYLHIILPLDIIQ